MASNPLNLALRFILEMATLVAVGVAGWQQFDGVAGWLAAIGLPVAMAAVWGTFAVPDDPSRGGSAPVPVPGAVRLLVEGLFFAGGVVALWSIGSTTLALVFAAVVAVHYALSWDRIVWLVSGR